MGVITNVAGTGQAGVQLSQSLYNIASRLVNAPEQIVEVADEITLLSNIFPNLGEALKMDEKLWKEDIIRHTESIRRRFESLQKDVTELIEKIEGFEQLKYAFGMSSISDLMAKIGALKSSMCLLLSAMHVAIPAQKSKRPKKRRSSKASSKKEVVEQSRILSEAYVESVRHAIIRLKATARRNDARLKADNSFKEKESLAFRHWSESLDETAHWLFDMVFAPYQRTRGRLFDYHGDARTIKSAEADSPAFDSDDKGAQSRPHPLSNFSKNLSSASQNLSHDPTSDLNAMTNTREITNELLGTWTNLNKHQIEESASWSALADRSTWDRTLNKLIRACIDDDEKAAMFPYQSEESFEGHPNFEALRLKTMRGIKPANTTRKMIRPSAPSPPPGQLGKQDNKSLTVGQDDKSKNTKTDGRTEVYFAQRRDGIFEPRPKVSDVKPLASTSADLTEGEDDDRTVYTIGTSVAETSAQGSNWTGLTANPSALSPHDGDETKQTTTENLGEADVREWPTATTKVRKKEEEAVVERETTDDLDSLKTHVGTSARNEKSNRSRVKKKASNATDAMQTPATRIKAHKIREDVGTNRSASSVSRSKSNLSARFLLPHAPTKEFGTRDGSESNYDGDESKNSADRRKWAVPDEHYLPYNYPNGGPYPREMSVRPPSYYSDPYVAPTPISYHSGQPSRPPLLQTRISRLEERLREATEELEREKRAHAEQVAALRQSAADREVESATRRDQKFAELEALINRQLEEHHAREDAMNTERSKCVTDLDSKLQSAVQGTQAQAITKAREEVTEQYEQKLLDLNRYLLEADRKAGENQRLFVEAQKRVEEAQIELEAVREQLSEKTRYDPWPYYVGISHSSEDEAATSSPAAREVTENSKGKNDQGQTAPSSSAANSPTPLNFIEFPSRDGWGLHEETELNSSLEKYGFKPLFEDHVVDATAANTNYLQRMGSGGSRLRGTLLWKPTRSPTFSEVYRSLLNCKWRPLYMRANRAGQTWFLGCQPIHVNFFKPWYIPQLQPADPASVNGGSAEDSLILGTECVDPEALDHLGFKYTKLESGRLLLDPRMTSLDINHVVALSFLLREGGQRKHFRDLELSRPPPNPAISEINTVSGQRPLSAQSTEQPVRSRRLLSRLLSNPRSTSQTLVDPVHLK